MSQLNSSNTDSHGIIYTLNSSNKTATISDVYTSNTRDIGVLRYFICKDIQIIPVNFSTMALDSRNTQQNGIGSNKGFVGLWTNVNDGNYVINDNRVWTVDNDGRVLVSLNTNYGLYLPDLNDTTRVKCVLISSLSSSGMGQY